MSQNRKHAMLTAKLRIKNARRFGTYEGSVVENRGTFLTSQGVPTLRGEVATSRPSQKLDLAGNCEDGLSVFLETALPFESLGCGLFSGPPVAVLHLLMRSFSIAYKIVPTTIPPGILFHILLSIR